MPQEAGSSDNNAVLEEPRGGEHTQFVEEPTPELPDDWEQIIDGSAEPAPEQDSNAEEPDPQEDEPTEDLAEENQRLKALLANIAQRMRQQGQAPQGQAPPKSEVDNVLDGLELDDSTRKQLKAFGEAVAKEVRAPLQQEINQLKGAVNSDQGSRQIAAFDNALKEEMAKAGLNEVEQRMMLPTVKFEGLQQYGQAFNMPQAKRVMRGLLNEYLKTRVSADDQQYTEARREQNNAPPPTQRGSNQAAVADIEKTMRASSSRPQDIGGADWRRYIRAKLKKAGAA